jgi:hypothetical protein
MIPRCDEHVGELYPPRCSACDDAALHELRVATLSTLSAQQVAALSYHDVTPRTDDEDVYADAWAIAHAREQKEAMPR